MAKTNARPRRAAGTVARGRKKSRAGRTRSRRARLALVPLARAAARGTSTRGAAAADQVPVATLAANGGPVTVGIAFGQAQHARYTIQVFDPHNVEIVRQAGLNTDLIPDEFALQGAPSQLDRHLIQWSGAVSAFTPAPGQRFSVIFDVTQNGVAVPGGHVERSGPLNVTQAFVGILRLVAQ